MNNCTHLPREAVWDKLFLFCFSQQWRCELCLHVYYCRITKVGQTQQRPCSVFSKQRHCQVFWGKCLCGYILSVSQFSVCIVFINSVSALSFPSLVVFWSHYLWPYSWFSAYEYYFCSHNNNEISFCLLKYKLNSQVCGDQLEWAKGNTSFIF